MASPLLTRKRGLSRDEWHLLIEEQIRRIEPLLGRLTFPTLGGLRCLKKPSDPGWDVALESGDPIVRCEFPYEGGLLSLEGIFGCTRPDNSPAGMQSGTLPVWGFSAKTGWIAAEATINMIESELGLGRCGCLVEACTHLVVQQSTIKEIIAVHHPWGVLVAIQKALQSARYALERRLDEANSVLSQVSEDVGLAHDLVWSEDEYFSIGLKLSREHIRPHRTMDILGHDDATNRLLIRVYFRKGEQVCDQCGTVSQASPLPACAACGKLEVPQSGVVV
ncbi:MAG: hypothetical protein BWY68_00470 [bacterium ADurb.Bin400]|nr:MAG: hypothetical protein BWY68_00470 [bacterium ADurb.Bin400]